MNVSFPMEVDRGVWSWLINLRTWSTTWLTGSTPLSHAHGRRPQNVTPTKRTLCVGCGGSVDYCSYGKYLHDLTHAYD